MKCFVIVLLCAVAYAQDLLDADQYSDFYRSRRDTGVILKDLVVPDDKRAKGMGAEPPKGPALTIGLSQRVIDEGGLKGDVYGGARITSGKIPSPEVGATLTKEFEKGGQIGVGGFARAEKNPLGSFSPIYGVDGSYKTKSGWKTDLKAVEQQSPWGKSQSVGAGFGKEWDNGNGYAGINAGAQRTPFSGWEPILGGGIRFQF